jgi:hypothetical protein
MKLVAQTARRTNVLYVATDGREAKLAKGAFDKSHPHLTLEFTTDVTKRGGISRRTAAATRCSSAGASPKPTRSRSSRTCVSRRCRWR